MGGVFSDSSCMGRSGLLMVYKLWKSFSSSADICTDAGGEGCEEIGTNTIPSPPDPCDLLYTADLLHHCFIKMYIELQHQAGGHLLNNFLCRRPTCVKVLGSMPGAESGLDEVWGGTGGWGNLLRLGANHRWETRCKTLQIKVAALIKMSAVFFLFFLSVLWLLPTFQLPPGIQPSNIYDANVYVKCHKLILVCFKRCFGPGVWRKASSRADVRLQYHSRPSQVNTAALLEIWITNLEQRQCLEDKLLCIYSHSFDYKVREQ